MKTTFFNRGFTSATVIVAAVVVIIAAIGAYYAFVEEKNRFENRGKIDYSRLERALQHDGQTKDDDVVNGSDGTYLSDSSSSTTPERSPLACGFETGRDFVYYQGRVVPDAQASEFICSRGRFAKDKDNLFYAGAEAFVFKVDGPTFEFIFNYFEGGGPGKDRNNLYVLELDEGDIKNRLLDQVRMTKVIPYDSVSFQEVGTCQRIEKSSAAYYKDDRTVYIIADDILIVGGADSVSFKIIGKVDSAMTSFSFAADRNRVYWGCGQVIEGADPTTFQILTDGYSRDSDHVFLMDKVILGADPESFQYVGEDYAKDSKNVYQGARILQGENPANCTSSNFYGCDRNYDPNRG